MQKKRPVKSYLFSAVCFGLAAVLFAAAVPLQFEKLLTMRLAAMLCAALGALMAVLALQGQKQKMSIQQFGSPVQPTVRAKPPVPSLPSGHDPADLCLGSLRGAVNTLPEFEKAFQDPVCRWQVERTQLALARVLDLCEASPEPALLFEFAAGYLPSVMQYLAACAVEGCPNNALRTLAGIALACEKQQDALKAGEKAEFKIEYQSLRYDLEQAGFRWDKSDQ